ncbi:M4 family metallopeptidase [Hyalangium versicolor]|uniref:M4 family metallopeptidase n=1 Tax=Hyalangium versicolor TaxID=2861190 RepID=UPI001CCCB502|nr:M4 family metallopeptidase [Hyalangium versicolor]
MRTRLLAACLTVSLTACGGAGPEPREQPEPQGLVRTSTQDIQVALAALPGTEVVGAHEDGVPFMIQGPLGTVDRSLRAATALEVHAQVGSALSRVAPVFRLSASDLVPQRVMRDELGHTHLRYAQMRNGLPVVGQELILHVDAEGRIYAANGTARDGESVPASAQAKLSAEAAAAVAVSSTPGGRGTQGTPRLVYVRTREDQRLALAFEAIVTGDKDARPVQEHVFIHALDGSVVERYSDIHEARNRIITRYGQGVVRIEDQLPTGDVAVDKTYDNLGLFYDCYKTLFNRDSFDNAGAALKATVHYNANYVNAYWDGNGMVCTDGDGVTSDAPCKDPDVVVHELTHAVTERTSNLAYTGESGGLSESLSDVFAAVCESWSRGFVLPDPDVWKIAEEVWTPNTTGDALRWMNNPKLDGASLDYYRDYYSGVDVHYSSGIPNLAFYLLAQGGTHPTGRSTLNVTGIGVEKAARIFYRANTAFMTSATSFTQAAKYTEYAATQLYTSAEVDSVTRAWTAVGVDQVIVEMAYLQNGVAVTGLSGAANSSRYFYMEVPANKPVAFTMSGGTGDADLYVKRGGTPTTSLYDCRPYLVGNNETCNLAATTAASRYYVMLRGYSAYSGVSLKGQYTP